MNTTVEGGHEHTPTKAVHRIRQATNAPLAQDNPETKHTAKQLEITMWHNENSLHKTPASTPLHSKHKASRSLCQQSKNKSQTATNKPTNKARQLTCHKTKHTVWNIACLTNICRGEKTPLPESKETDEHQQQDTFGKLNGGWQAVDG